MIFHNVFQPPAIIALYDEIIPSLNHMPLRKQREIGRVLEILHEASANRFRLAIAIAVSFVRVRVRTSVATVRAMRNNMAAAASHPTNGCRKKQTAK
ncbi:hypothetical protein GFL80_34105 [Rhizobium leguminosarum bv. viciae]|nr:hypothetical protein [Rhizobium leguminosarum bv. viciae]